MDKVKKVSVAKNLKLDVHTDVVLTDCVEH